MPSTYEQGSVEVYLDELLKEQGMTLTELARRINLTQANVSILKTGKAKAIRFSTLSAICRELECQPGDLLRYVSNAADGERSTSQVGVENRCGLFEANSD